MTTTMKTRLASDHSTASLFLSFSAPLLPLLYCSAQAFVYIFNVFQIPNVAWQSYLQLSLDFQPWMLVRQA